MFYRKQVAARSRPSYTTYQPTRRLRRSTGPTSSPGVSRTSLIPMESPATEKSTRVSTKKYLSIFIFHILSHSWTVLHISYSCNSVTLPVANVELVLPSSLWSTAMPSGIILRELIRGFFVPISRMRSGIYFQLKPTLAKQLFR